MRYALRSQLVVIALLLLMAAGPSPAGARITVGDTVPSINLLNWEGQAVNLAELRGKVVVIDFWASWCVVRRQALPALEAISRRFAGSPVMVVAINIDKERSMATAFSPHACPCQRC